MRFSVDHAILFMKTDKQGGSKDAFIEYQAPLYTSLTERLIFKMYIIFLDEVFYFFLVTI